MRNYKSSERERQIIATCEIAKQACGKLDEQEKDVLCCWKKWKKEEIMRAQEKVCQMIEELNRGQEKEKPIDLSDLHEIFEDPSIIKANLSVDDVCCKKQKASGRKKGSPPKETREMVSNTVAHHTLINSLDRTSNGIPCYALRKKLGLRISSNPVEKANDLLVSTRQKQNGMSWSADGSTSLATLTTVRRKGQDPHWLLKHDIRFQFDAGIQRPAA